jgi:hypothetical protein
MHDGIEQVSEGKRWLPDAAGAFLPTDLDDRLRAHHPIRPAR